MASIYSELDTTRLTYEELVEDLKRPTLTSDLRAIILQELTRRNLLGIKESLDHLDSSFNKADENNYKFSRILVFFAIVQIIIAIFQLIVPFFVTGSLAEEWKGIGVAIVLALFVGYVGWDYFRSEKKKGES